MGIFNRARLSNAEKVLVEAKYNTKGQMVDPNTGKVLEKGKIDLGHKYGYEERVMQRCAARSGLSQKDYSKMMRNSKLYQWEDRSENRSRRHECKNSREQIHKCMQVIREYKNKDNGKNLKSSKERNAVSKTMSLTANKTEHSASKSSLPHVSRSVAGNPGLKSGGSQTGGRTGTGIGRGSSGGIGGGKGK